MWYSLIQWTHFKVHNDLFHLFYRRIFFILLKRVNDRVLLMFFELIIILLETFEVVLEEVQVTERLVTLFLFGSGYDFALLKFLLLLDFISIQFDTN